MNLHHGSKSSTGDYSDSQSANAATLPLFGSQLTAFIDCGCLRWLIGDSQQ